MKLNYTRQIKAFHCKLKKKLLQNCEVLVYANILFYIINVNLDPI